MRTILQYNFLLAVILTGLISCEGRRLPPLEESFSKSDKNPFGTYVAFREINELFYRNDVRVKRTSADKSLDDFGDTASLFISISRHFYLRRTESSALLSFVKRGNDVFISARDFDTAFAREVNVAIQNNPFNSFLPSIMDMRYTAVRLAPFYFHDSVSYQYYYNPFTNAFAINPKLDKVKVLGTNEKGEPNFVVIFYGRGRMYLHCEPRAFSNYFLLQNKNYKYLQRVFSLMPAVPHNVYWDDYYNKRDYLPKENDHDDKNSSGLSVLLRYPAMAWAFWLSLLLLIIYLLFGGKRRQRIIKTIPQTENTSVAFTETVGRLYLQKKDNRNIADKMITYLMEHIRTHYFISTNQLNSDFTAMLSRKTSLPTGQIESLVDTINTVQQAENVDDPLLISLNQQIENFYKHKTG